MEQIRKARKRYVCDCCEKTIQKGQKYRYQSYRWPRVDENDRQIGIEYAAFRSCLEHDDETQEYEE